jgi:hypothetical protein
MDKPASGASKAGTEFEAGGAPEVSGTVDADADKKEAGDPSNGKGSWKHQEMDKPASVRSKAGTEFEAAGAPEVSGTVDADADKKEAGDPSNGKGSWKHQEMDKPIGGSWHHKETWDFGDHSWKHEELWRQLSDKPVSGGPEAVLEAGGAIDESGAVDVDAKAKHSLRERIENAESQHADAKLESSQALSLPEDLKIELDAAVAAAKVSGKAQAQSMAETIYSTAKTQQDAAFALAAQSETYREGNYTQALDMSEDAEKAASILGNAYQAKSTSEQAALRDWVVSHASIK